MKSSVGAEINNTSSDEFQERYLAHQTHEGGKRDELIQIMRERHSNRRFDDSLVEDEQLETILEALKNAPSSCDRFGVRVKIETERDRKTLLNGLLVGGTGWIYRAPVVLMLWGNPEAYKGGENGDEVTYNLYLDAGVMAQTAMLVATSQGLHTAFCNPQVRSENREFFIERYKPQWKDAIFAGAVAIGNRHPEPIEKSRRLIDTVVVE
jgi:nitroreductase